MITPLEDLKSVAEKMPGVVYGKRHPHPARVLSELMAAPILPVKRGRSKLIDRIKFKMKGDEKAT